MLEISKDANEAVEYTSAPNAALPPVIQREVILYPDEPRSLEDGLAELDTALETDDRVLIRPQEGLKLAFKKGQGEFSVQGAATHLGVTVIGMLTALGLVVYSSHPVSDAYIPMVLMATGGIGISYMDSRRKKS